jgi:hypothetical protein
LKEKDRTDLKWMLVKSAVWAASDFE